MGCVPGPPAGGCCHCREGPTVKAGQHTHTHTPAPILPLVLWPPLDFAPPPPPRRQTQGGTERWRLQFRSKLHSLPPPPLWFPLVHSFRLQPPQSRDLSSVTHRAHQGGFNEGGGGGGSRPPSPRPRPHSRRVVSQERKGFQEGDPSSPPPLSDTLVWSGTKQQLQAGGGGGSQTSSCRT